MRRALLIAAVAALLSPLTTGFYASCNKNTVGFYPSYPNVKSPGLWNHFEATQDAATDADIKATTLFVHWADRYPAPESIFFYDPITCERQDQAIADFVAGHLDQWSKLASSGGRELNLNIVIPIHLPHGSTFDIGPACKGYDSNDYTSLSFIGEFLAFVDVIGDTVSRPEYQKLVFGQDAGVQVLLGIGNEVDLYLGRWYLGPPDPVKWTNFNNFLSTVIPPIQTSWSGLNPAFGTSVTFLSPSINSDIGTWNPYTGSWSPTLLHVWDLALRTGSLVFTYYPFDVGQQSAALDPNRPHTDLANMALFANAIGTVSPWPVYIQEVGYPTDDQLHTIGGGTYAGGGNGQLNQVTFVTALFDAWSSHRDEIRGVSWWPLLDWSATPTEPLCTDAWPDNGDRFNVAMCTTGLYDFAPVTNEAIPKPAWATFRDRAQQVPGW